MYVYVYLCNICICMYVERFSLLLFNVKTHRRVLIRSAMGSVLSHLNTIQILTTYFYTSF
jgi:hypothetical protein